MRKPTPTALLYATIAAVLAAAGCGLAWELTTYGRLSFESGWIRQGERGR